MADFDLGDGVSVRMRPPLPADVDARNADRTTLAQHGLPSRPDSPQLADRWDEFFSRRPTWIRAELETMAEMRQHDSASASAPNWAAGCLKAPAGEVIKLVVGQWHVPYIDVPERAVDGTLYDACTWVGIDDSDIVQGGVQTFVSTTKGGLVRTKHAFFQWFGNSLGQRVQGFPVDFGDEVGVMMCVDVDDATSGLAIYNNLTQNVATSIPVSAAKKRPSIGNRAEWVVERTSPSHDVYRPLAKFTPVQFTNALAATAGLETVLEPGRDGFAIDMEVAGVVLARATLVGATTVDVNYQTSI